MYRAKVAVPAPAVKSASVGHAARVALRARVVLDCVGQRMWCVVCDCGMACEVYGVSVRVYVVCDYATFWEVFQNQEDTHGGQTSVGASFARQWSRHGPPREGW